MSAFAVRGSGDRPSILLVFYRGLIIILLGSIPIGVALAWSGTDMWSHR